MTNLEALLQSRDVKYFLIIERCTYLFNLQTTALIQNYLKIKYYFVWLCIEMNYYVVYTSLVLKKVPRHIQNIRIYIESKEIK